MIDSDGDPRVVRGADAWSSLLERCWGAAATSSWTGDPWRGAGNHISPQGAGLSKHAELRRTDDGWLLIDLG